MTLQNDHRRPPGAGFRRRAGADDGAGRRWRSAASATSTHTLNHINDVNNVKQRHAINFRGSVHDRAIALRDVVLAADAARRKPAARTIRHAGRQLRIGRRRARRAVRARSDILPTRKARWPRSRPTNARPSP
jgi:hypothetical protein